jgi:heat shock protein HtpX
MKTNLERRSEMHLAAAIAQSALIISLMGGVCALLAWSLFGPEALPWGAGIAVAALLVSPRISPPTVMRMLRGRLLAPAQAPEVFDVLESLAIRAGLSVTPRLYLVPSAEANALSVGSRNNSAVALTQGLIDSLSLRELAGVIGHEIGHIASGDLWVMNLARTASQITSGLAFIGRILLLINLPLILFGAAGLPWLFVLLLVAAPFATSLLELALSRAREFAADRIAADLTGDPEGFASALAKIDRRSSLLARIFGIPGRRGGSPFLSTHPPNEQRIKRLLENRERRDLETSPGVPFL